MSAPSRTFVGVGLLLAILGVTPSCSKPPARRDASVASAVDAVFLGLLDEVQRSWDEARAKQAIVKVVGEPRFVAPLLAVLADRDHRCLVAAIRCAGAIPVVLSPDDEAARPTGVDADDGGETAAAATWTDPENPANARLQALLLPHLHHREPSCRVATLAALAARRQLPATASELLEDPDTTVRAAAVTACLQVEAPPWADLAAAWLSLSREQVEQLPLAAPAAKQLGGEVSGRIDWHDTDALLQQLPLLARLDLPDPAIAGLVATLARGDEPLAAAVLAFLAERGNALADAQPVLRVALDQGRPAELRHLAFACLESCRAAVVADLQQAMLDLDGSLRIAAARAMIRAGSQAGIDVLCDVAQDDEESGQRARLLLSRLAGASSGTSIEDLRSRIATRDLQHLRLP